MKRISLLCRLAVLVLLVGCAEVADRGQTEKAAEQSTETQESGTGSGVDEAVTEEGSGKVSSEQAETGGTQEGTDQSQGIVFGDQFPEVLKVSATETNGKWRFSVTLSSTYDSPERYADAWRVLDDQDKELGIRVLGHDHASEQPFTRSGSIEVPVGAKTVFVEGRDKGNGWSGQRFEFKMP